MTPLERTVLAEMVRLNAPMRPGDPPYPACMMPIVQAVIATVQNHQAEQLLDMAAKWDAWGAPMTEAAAWPYAAAELRAALEADRDA